VVQAAAAYDAHEQGAASSGYSDLDNLGQQLQRGNDATAAAAAT